ncbi:hypothetical protein BDV95DRAFT_478826, partial [Massariosphaeria phaeospora]
IGLILSNGTVRNDKYECHIPACSGTTFGRLADLKRHHATRHAETKPEFWCPVEGCVRSLDGGGHSFPRKDKMEDHFERIHGGEMFAGYGDVSGGGSKA